MVANRQIVDFNCLFASA